MLGKGADAMFIDMGVGVGVVVGGWWKEGRCLI